MGYDSLIKNKVDKAFKDIGDLATEVKFIQATTDGFDFSTSEVVDGTTKSLTIKAIITNSKNQTPLVRTSGEGLTNSIKNTLLVKTSDINTDLLTVYSKVIINNIEWTIVPPFKDSGYTVTLDVIREI